MQEPGSTLEAASVRRVWIYLVLGGAVGLQFALQGALSLMLPQLHADLGSDETELGLLSSLFFLPYVLLQVPSGYLMSSFGRARLLMLSSLLMVVGCLVQAYAQSFSTMVVGRLLMGVGASPIIVCFLRTIEILFPARLFGALAAGMEAFGMLGAALGDALLPTAISDWGWRGAMEVLALLSIIPALGGISMPREKRDNPCDRQEQADGRGWRNVLCNSDIWCIAFFSGFLFSIDNAFGALWAIPFLESMPGVNGDSGLMVSLLFVGTAMGAPALGWLVDHRWSGRRTMIGFGLLTAVLLVVVISGSFSAGFYYLLMFLLGAVSSCYILPFTLLRHWFSGKELAVGLALVNSVCVMVGSLFYQPLIGVLLGFFEPVNQESYRLTLYTLPVGIVLACLLVMRLPLRVGVSDGAAHQAGEQRA
ncbi:MAG: MFS transporter [Kistimonas sp.]|nr:MFS transporter [Kistimonas sp.]